MTVPAAVARKVALQEPYVKRVAERVRDAVQAYAAEHTFAFVDRRKGVTSLAEKIETGRYPNWSALDDCYGCAVVVPTLADEQAVLEFLRSAFVEHAVRGRGTTQKDPEVFRFDATRFIGRLTPDPSIDAASPLASVLFEIQIRTAFEHAWAVTTHSWSYKGNRVDWRRLRLVAQLKAAVEQLDALVAGFSSIEQSLSEQHWPQVAAQQQVELYFRDLLESGEIPPEATPASWTRFAQNFSRVVASGEGPVRSVQTAIHALDDRGESWKGEQFPRSLSLLQACIGVLAESGHLRDAPRGYSVLVTEELRSLFPATAGFGQTFDLELAPDGGNGL